jgi:phosphatidylglycerol:prolipoprotein diacylglycerol transferase
MNTVGNYWTHNLSEFVFRVQNINYTWLPTWYGILGVAVFFLGGFAGLWFWGKQRQAQNQDTGIIESLRYALSIVMIAFFGFWGLQKAGIDWGLRWYSTMYVLAYVQIYLVALHWVKRKNIMLTHILLDSLIAYIFIGMLLGARTFYVFIYNWGYYKDNWGDMLKVWHGGLSFHGGIVGVFIAGVLFARRYEIPFAHLFDRMALTAPFGIAIGRLGNFLNGGELYGRVISSDIPWAVIFPNGGPLPRHPSQIYQSLCEGWLLLLTLFLLSRKRYREGTIGAAFVFFYGLYRFPMEYFREADEQLKYYFNNSLTMGQILCIITMLIGAFLFWLSRRNIVDGGEAWQTRHNAFFKKREEIEQSENSAK